MRFADLGVGSLSLMLVLTAWGCGGRSESAAERGRSIFDDNAAGGEESSGSQRDRERDSDNNNDDVPPDDVAPISPTGPTGANGPVAVAPAGPIPVPAGPGGPVSVSTEPLPPGLPWPEGCDTGMHDAHDFGCTAQLNCDPGFAFVFCDASSGDSQCFCDAGGRGTEVVVSGVSPNEACAYAASECLSTHANTERECAVTGQSVGTGYCDTNRTCSSSASMHEDGVSTHSTSHDGVQCSQQDGGWFCGCYGKNTQFSFDGTSDQTEVCSAALSVCDEISVQDFGGPATCENESIYASRYDCDVQDQCLRQGVTPSGTRIQAVEYRSVNCYNGAYGGGVPPLPPGVPQPVPEPSSSGADPNSWTCSCNGSFQQLGEAFELNGEKSLEVCQEAAKVCGERFE